MEVREMARPEGRCPGETVVVMTELVLPMQTNLLNNLLGGQLMHFMDIAGALTCKRHSGCEVVTVAVEKIEFTKPVHLGEIITITSKLIWVGRTSMITRITVRAENPKTGESTLTNTAYFTFVALDDDGKPAPVPRLLPETEEEKLDFEKQQRRYEAQKAKKAAK